MLRRFTEEWSIDLDGDYRRDVIDGQLRFMVPGRTIWLNVWSKAGIEVADTLNWIRAGARESHPKHAEEFEEGDADEARYASWYSEPGRDAMQHSLYGYTIRTGSYVQSVFISDSPADRDWALERWRSLRFEHAAPKPAALQCLATRRITQEHLQVRWMYREEPDHAGDSGWRFFSGVGEDDAYLSNPDNAGVYDVQTIAGLDPSIAPFLQAPVGSAFERQEDEWVKVTDWSPLN